MLFLLGNLVKKLRCRVMQISKYFLLAISVNTVSRFVAKR